MPGLLSDLLYNTPKAYWSEKLSGLLDAASLGARTYAGATQPYTAEQAKTIGGLLADFTPVVGDVKSGYEGVQAAREGDWLGAGMGALGALPFVPGMAGMIRTATGRIPETAADTRSLADMLQRAGERSGYVVNRSDSAISPSRYVTFSKIGDDIGDTARQVRISNHADKYPEMANGIRSSVDPSTGVSFEQSVNWLKKEGFPTSLSTRFNDVPSWEQHYAARRVADSTPEVRLQRLQAAWLNKPKATRGPRPTIEDVK